MATKIFKLVSGDEVLADVMNETKEFVQLKNPTILTIVAEGQLGLMPWLPLAEKNEITLDTRNIMFSYVPKQGLANHYREATGGLVVAPAGALNQLPSNFGR